MIVCEWFSDVFKVIVFGFNICLVNGMFMNMMMMSDENYCDIYVSIVVVLLLGCCVVC